MCVVVCIYVYVLELNEIILKCSAQCLVYEIHILIFVICMLIMKIVTMEDADMTKRCCATDKYQIENHLAIYFDFH